MRIEPRVTYRYKARLDVAPFSLLLAIAAIPVGATAVVLGADVSRAITNVLEDAAIPHVWGAAMLVGGLLTMYGVTMDRGQGEYAGLRLLSFALAFYSACCYTGLGLGGIVSGSFAGAYAIGCYLRSRRMFTVTIRQYGSGGSGHDGET